MPVPSHRMSGSIMRSKRRGERGSPCNVPRRMGMAGVGPWGVRMEVVACAYKLATIETKSGGMPRSVSMRVSCRWSTDGYAPLKSI